MLGRKEEFLHKLHVEQQAVVLQMFILFFERIKIKF